MSRPFKKSLSNKWKESISRETRAGSSFALCHLPLLFCHSIRRSWEGHIRPAFSFLVVSICHHDGRVHRAREPFCRLAWCFAGENRLWHGFGGHARPQHVPICMRLDRVSHLHKSLVGVFPDSCWSRRCSPDFCARVASCLTARQKNARLY